MPRTSRAIPTYRHHKARNLAVVTLSGKSIYLGKYDTPESRREYDRIIGEWLASNRLAPPARTRRSGGADRVAANLTVAELLARYWTFVQGYYQVDGKPTHEVAGIKLALRPLRRTYGHTEASSFGPVALKALRHDFIESGLSRTTVNARIGKVKRFFRWAVAEELISASVHQALLTVDGLKAGRSAARETAPVRPVEADRVAITLPHLTGPVRAMVEMQSLTAMRPGEVVRMKPREIDRSGAVWVYSPTRHKNKYRGHGRAICLGPKAQEVLRPWLRDDAPDAFVFRPADGFRVKAPTEAPPKRKKRAAPGRTRRTRPKPGRRINDCYSVLSYYSSIRAGCAKAFPHPTLDAIPKAKLTTEQRDELRRWRRDHAWSPNRLRHQAATLIRTRFGLEAAQVVLGHAKANVTEVYAQRDLSKAVEVARAIG